MGHKINTNIVYLLNQDLKLIAYIYKNLIRITPKEIDSLIHVCLRLKTDTGIVQAPVVQKVDNAIHRINHYPVDSVVCFVNIYPLDSDLSGG